METVKGIFFTIVCTFCLSKEISAQTVEVIANESMPFQGIENGKPVGISIDLLEEVTRNGGPKFTYRVGVPHIRGLMLIAAAENLPVAYISLTRTPERESNYTWITKLFAHTIVAMTYKRPAPMTILDARNQSAGILRGSAAIPLVLRHRFTKVHEAGSAIQNANMLKLGRIDLIIESDVVGEYNWNKLGFEPQHLHKGVEIGDTLTAYIAGNPSFPQEIAIDINNAMEKMMQNGKYQTIIEKWISQDDLIEKE